jgi:hypothetical protein
VAAASPLNKWLDPYRLQWLRRTEVHLAVAFLPDAVGLGDMPVQV